MPVLEKEIEAKLKAMIERRGGLCLKWTCPGWLGVPDRICLLPRGQVIFVETKRPTGSKRSAMQRWWARKLSALGFLHLWVKCEEDVRALESLIRGLPSMDEWAEIGSGQNYDVLMAATAKPPTEEGCS